MVFGAVLLPACEPQSEKEVFDVLSVCMVRRYGVKIRAWLRRGRYRGALVRGVGCCGRRQCTVWKQRNAVRYVIDVWCSEGQAWKRKCGRDIQVLVMGDGRTERRGDLAASAHGLLQFWCWVLAFLLGDSVESSWQGPVACLKP